MDKKPLFIVAFIVGIPITIIALVLVIPLIIAFI